MLSIGFSCYKGEKLLSDAEIGRARNEFLSHKSIIPNALIGILSWQIFFHTTISSGKVSRTRKGTIYFDIF